MTGRYSRTAALLLRGGAAIALLFAASGDAAAQERVGGTVEGVVATERGDRLAGASVLVSSGTLLAAIGTGRSE